jgi:hypothetical protein
MSDLEKGDICVVGKGDETFVGIFQLADGSGCLLTNARLVLYSPFAIASEGLNQCAMEKHVSGSVDQLAIYGLDTLIKPKAEISSAIAKLFGLEDVAEDE